MKIYAFHGNPGSATDWKYLKNHLTPSDQLICVSYENDNWMKTILSEPEPVLLVGHSYGCYRILKALPALKSKVASAHLINPYIFPERQLSGIVTALLSTPILGAKLISANHAKSWRPLFLDIIHPDQAQNLDIYKDIENHLSKASTWNTTVKRKIEMQKNPWSPKDLTETPLHIYWGSEDKISTASAQLSQFENNSRVKIHHFSKKGHGLLWTDAEILVQMMKNGVSTKTQNKIGYYPGSDQRNNVITFMEKHLAEFPDKIALKWIPRDQLATWNGDHNQKLIHQSISFRHLAARIQVVAKGLLDIGIQKGDRVIIFLPMSLDMYVAMFAVQRIGAIAVFLDSWARSHHLGASADCVGPKAMISFQQAFALVDQVPEFNSMPIRILYGPGEKFTHKFEDLLKAQGEAPIADVESETTALITFTTGSTGKPKGANRTHRFLSAQHHALDHVIPYSAHDQDMPAFPIFSLNNLAGGVTTILPAIDLASPAPTDGALLASQLIGETASCTTLSPSQLNGLTKYCLEKNLQLPMLRRVVTGGAPISKDDVAQFYKVAPQSELWILYGSTEAEPMAHIEGRDMLKEDLHQDPEVLEEGVNVGHISEDIEFKFIKLIDGGISWPAKGWKELEVPTNEVGEFICTGDHVCREYYNNQDAFYATKIMDNTGKVWHRTGDLAYIDNKKQLWIVGRVNNAISRGGKYFFPVRAEVLLKRFSFTARCAFLGMDDANLGQATWAAIELKSTEALPEKFEDYKKEVQRIFAKNKIPLDRIVFVQSIPMDPRHHSKVEYKVLKDQLKTNKDFIIG